jgi:hypothetical protein
MVIESVIKIDIYLLFNLWESFGCLRHRVYTCVLLLVKQNESAFKQNVNEDFRSRRHAEHLKGPLERICFNCLAKKRTQVINDNHSQLFVCLEIRKYQQMREIILSKNTNILIH